MFFSGFQGFTVVLGIASFALAVPVTVIAAVSTRVERAAASVASEVVPVQEVTA